MNINRFASIATDDEHIYDSISDFDQTHFQTHSSNDMHRPSCKSFTVRKNVADANEKCWQQYWDWYFFCFPSNCVVICCDTIYPVIKLLIPIVFCFLSFSEQSIIGARASVMVYDDNQKKWIPSGTSSGLSKVHIYHHQQNNTFRVVGRKLQDHEVVINCSILKGLKYNQATPTFHQWRDSKFVYGLNFSSQQDAEAFARAMLHALEVRFGRDLFK